jgi:hypothetical protein
MLTYLRWFYKKLIRNHKTYIDTKDFSRINLSADQTSKIIFDWIESGRPFIVSRFGNIELTWYIEYKILSRNIFYRSYNFVINRTRSWRKENRLISHPYFVPEKSDEVTRFYINKMDNVIPDIDLLGSWSAGESLKILDLKCDKFSHIFDIEPYWAFMPWSLALKNKKVLIIHPMVDLFIMQMKNKDRLFNFPVLPDFEIIPIKALFFDDPVYDSWIKIYEYYSEIISQTVFDVAIIGCGTWGMPLCYEVKKKGKQVIHLGGATQILFGVMGKRWRDWPEYSQMVNEFWITEHNNIPSAAKVIENGCYW